MARGRHSKIIEKPSVDFSLEPHMVSIRVEVFGTLFNLKDLIDTYGDFVRFEIVPHWDSFSTFVLYDRLETLEEVESRIESGKAAMAEYEAKLASQVLANEQRLLETEEGRQKLLKKLSSELKSK